MDPNAAIEAITRGIRDGDWQLVADASEGLINWLSHGGFAPSNHARPMEYAQDALRYAAQRGAEVSA